MVSLGGSLDVQGGIWGVGSGGGERKLDGTATYIKEVRLSAAPNPQGAHASRAPHVNLFLYIMSVFSFFVRWRSKVIQWLSLK